MRTQRVRHFEMFEVVVKCWRLRLIRVIETLGNRCDLRVIEFAQVKISSWNVCIESFPSTKMSLDA